MTDPDRCAMFDPNALVAEARLADLHRELDHIARRLDKMRPAYDADSATDLHVAATHLRRVAKSGRPSVSPAPIPIIGDVSF